MNKKNQVRDDRTPLEISSPGERNAISPSIIREEAIDIAGSIRRKKILGIGTEEEIVSAGLIWWPFVHVTVRYMGGIIRKQIKETKFLLDGLTADGVSIDKGYKRYPLFSGFIGLDSISVMVLSAMSKEGSSEEEIALETGIPEKEVKKVLQKLGKKRLVTSSALPDGKKVRIPLYGNDFPKINNLQEKFPSLPLKHLEGISRPLSFSEEDISRILKGMEPECGITEFNTYYYPVYEVLLDDGKGKTRPLLIDGRTGKEIIS